MKRSNGVNDGSHVAKQVRLIKMGSYELGLNFIADSREESGVGNSAIEQHSGAMEEEELVHGEKLWLKVLA